jgi:hypothetical protein
MTCSSHKPRTVFNRFLIHRFILIQKVYAVYPVKNCINSLFSLRAAEPKPLLLCEKKAARNEREYIQNYCQPGFWVRFGFSCICCDGIGKR